MNHGTPEMAEEAAVASLAEVVPGEAAHALPVFLLVIALVLVVLGPAP
ncbi:MAG: hypothetical protein MUQ32_09800 [Chloroflexi bacterium]|nr:hypothetical protein [Chloroflexota bacterium]